MFLVRTKMITKNQQNTKSDFLPETNIEVPVVNPNSSSSSVMQPTLYDYLTVLPHIIAAATPLILGFIGFKNQQMIRKKGRQQPAENNDDVTKTDT